MPEVSVIIPTHNRSDLLSLTLATAASQRGVDLEIVVVDDASTDGTDGLLRSLADDRVRTVRNREARGVSASRNAGVEHARGEWIAFLDDDDLWAPWKLAAQLDALRAEGRRWGYGGDVIVNDRLEILAGSTPPGPEQVVASLKTYNSVPAGGSNVLAQVRLLEEAGPFDVGLSKVEDWDMWLRLAARGPPACVPEPLVAYRIHAGNAKLELTPMVDEPGMLRHRYGVTVDAASVHRRAAWTALRAGRKRVAIHHYWTAVTMGDFRSVARIAVASAFPARSEVLFRLVGRGSQDAYREEARRWLEPLRARSDLTRMEKA